MQSGGSDTVNTTASDTFSFRAPYSSADGGKTVANVWGDMGVFSWNNMENLKRDIDAEEVDLLIHLGDLAYNEGDDDERRGDGFMSAFQPVLASVPWMPVVGNHEYASGAKLGRFLDQNFEGWAPIIAGANTTAEERAVLAELRVFSTATSALGAFVSTGTHHAAGLHGGESPSGSSRYVKFRRFPLYFPLYFGHSELGLRGYTQAQGAAFSCLRLKLADMVLI